MTPPKPTAPSSHPPPAVSGKYRNAHLPQPLHLHSTVYVLSYEGSAWPDREQYDGIIGAYSSFENAKSAGTCWLDGRAGYHGGAATQIRVLGWVVKEGEGGEEWVKARGESGDWFLEECMVRIKRCEVRTDGRLVDEGRDGGAAEEVDDDEEGGKEEEGEDEGQEGHEGDEQADGKGKGNRDIGKEMQRLAL